MKMLWKHLGGSPLLVFIFACIGVFASVETWAAEFSTGPGDTGLIDDGVTCGTANLSRTITVTGVPTVSNLNVGFLATHSWRGDIRVDLISPAPTATRIRMIASNTSGAGSPNNYNIELGDEATTALNVAPHDTNDGTTAPPYENLVLPSNALTTFDGLNGNGDWTLEICDDYFGFDDGEFLLATLYFPNLTEADLSLSASASTITPEYGASVTLDFDLANAGGLAATNVLADITLPAGLTYLSHSGDGTFDDFTGVWTLPASLASGSLSTLSITAAVLPTGPYTVSTEITASDQPDGDSTPNNGSTSEDDDDSLTLAPVPASSPPPLTCPVIDQITHDWTAPGTTNGWNSNELSNSYTAGGIDLDMSVTGDTTYLANYQSVLTPYTSTGVTGGISPADHGVAIGVNFPNQSTAVTVTVDIGDPGVGVEAIQFPIFDVDFGQWADRITVTGSINGVAATPILSGSVSNSVSGNVAIGTAGANNSTSDGNISVTFLSPVDQVIFTYDNAPTAPSNPDFQVIKMHNVIMCPRLLADLSALKTVDVSNSGEYMTPGNEVTYTITVTNSAAADKPATDIDINDTLPDNVRFVSATATGFTGGSFGSPALPPASTDCAGAACVIHFSGGALDIDSSGAIEMKAVIK